MLSRKQPENPHILQTVACPVCKAILGLRFPEDKTFLHCEECRCTHLYLPHTAVPVKSTLDSDARHSHCGCGRCGH